MGRVTRRSIASKEESTPKESPKSGGRRGAKKTEEVAKEETPKRTGRQAAKEEQKAAVSAKEKSATRGRSTSRGGKAKKEEEPESPEVEETTNNVEGKTQRGGTRSRGKGKVVQEVKTTPARRGRKDKASEEGEDDEENAKDEVGKEHDEDSVPSTGKGGRAKGKTSVATQSSRGKSRSRSRAPAEEEKEDNLEEDSTDSKRDDDEASDIVDNNTEATPKSRQRRAPNKEAESSTSQPSSGARRGRAQKPTPKTSPPSGSAKKDDILVKSTDETSEHKDEAELMDTGEDSETVESKEIVENEESSTIVKAAPEKKELSTAEAIEVEEENLSIPSKEPLKKVESSTSEKSSEETEVPSTVQKTTLETEVPTATEKTALECDVSPTIEKAALETEVPSTTEKTAMETDVPSVAEEAALEIKGPSTNENTELESEVSSTTEKAALETEVPSTTEQMVVEESSEPVSPNKKRKLEGVEDLESSKPTSPNKKRKLEDDADCQTAKRPRADNSEPSEDMEEDIDNHTDDVPKASDVVDSLPSAVVEKSVDHTALEDKQEVSIQQQAVATSVPDSASSAEEEESKQKNTDEISPVTEIDTEHSTHIASVSSGGLDTISSNSVDATPADNAPKPVKDSPLPTTGDSKDNSLPQNDVPAAEELTFVENNSSDTATVVPQITLEASETQTFSTTDKNTESNNSSQSLPEAMEVQPVENTAHDKTVNQTPHPIQNGTKEISAATKSGPHLASSPDKSLSTVNKAYVPSSTAIDSRKLIPNPAFPVEMMDPAYCFSVVSYNILADCHLCRSDYSYTQPQYLIQDYRHSLLLKELEYLDADIVCLQEVSPSYYSKTLLPVMKSHGYEGHFIKRTKEFWDEGLATFVRTSKFDIVSNQAVSLKDLAFKEVDSTGLGEDISKAVKKYLDRADVILLTELCCKKSGKIVTICNIHVVHEVKAPDAQCFQVACAVKQLVAKAGGDQNPHIICGDFNSGVNSPAYQLVRDGYLSDDHNRRLQALESLDNTDGSSRALIHHMGAAFQHTSSNLKNTYECALGKEPPVTVFTKTSKSVDHIFHSAATIDNVGVLETLDSEVLKASGGLPSKNIPSDHLSLKAVFRMK